MQIRSTRDLRSVFAALLLALLAGCATTSRSSTVILVPDNSGRVGSAQLKNGSESVLLSASGEAAALKESHLEKGSASAADKKAFANALKAEPASPNIFTIYFLFGTDTVVPDSVSVLTQAAEAITNTKSNQINIFGHTDSVGEAGFNEELSIKRANLVKKLLLQHGVAGECLFAAGLGEADPAVESSKHVPQALNRRVEIVIH